ncbi:hypothetical protein RB614_03810 [Phytohabitans sp. ZYX-F-186]|uniref:Uncharacterized protein n=1 Tax=Phytohabitans maris TaxID=3071409 RepID=A0ABU0Z9B5_9ACTN|nr:hypothetical protein [Phytohabitans sp. ZYX-F-186]MDQ7903640.1 hypothetical protein [Phytohabitans sp. ZYX-F-186]
MTTVGADIRPAMPPTRAAWSRSSPRPPRTPYWPRCATARSARAIGTVAATPAGRVTARTLVGSTRVVDMLVGEQLPRIC